MQNGDEAPQSIRLADRGQLVKMLVTGMQNGDQASPSISPAVRSQLVKMLITLEPHGIL